MLKKIPSENLFIADHGWLKSRFHFSFAEYQNPQNMNFGMLRVLNDDIVQPGTGFPTHGHRDMEIISYIINGGLTHQDSMGNKETLERGHVQYMTAGTGITHSEMNDSLDTGLRFLQMWIVPDQKSRTPNYGSMHFKADDRHNNIHHIVSGKDKPDIIKISQDANVYICELEQNKELSHDIDNDRQIYLICIEGELEVNSITLSKRDALEITAEKTLNFKTISTAHFLFIDMPLA